MKKTDERKGWTSASYAEADTACPGRFQACKGLPGQIWGPDADRGTRVHDHLAGKPATLNPEEDECAQKLADAARRITTDWATKGVRLEFHFEERLWITFGKLKHSGKPDLVVVDREGMRALVIDYKSGWGDVTESPSNGQLRDLAVLTAVNYQVLEVTVCIAQTFGKPEPCLYQLDDLATANRLLEQRVRNCHAPDAPRIPGKEQCQYCLAVETCQEHHQWLAPALGGDQEFPATSVRQWTPEKRAWFCQCKAAVRKRLDAWEGEIKELLAEDPHAVPGWKLGKPSVRETIVDPQTVHERFVARAMQAGVHDDAKVLTDIFLKTLKVNKGDLKDTVRSLLGAKGQLLDDILHDLTKGCVEAKTCAPPLEEVS